MHTCFADRDFAKLVLVLHAWPVRSVPSGVMSEHIPFLRSRYGATAIASAALAAAAAAWYTSRSPITEVSPADNSTASPSGLLAPVRFKVCLAFARSEQAQKNAQVKLVRGLAYFAYATQVPLRQADGTFPPSLYCWAANLQSRMSGTLEDVEGTPALS